MEKNFLTGNYADMRRKVYDIKRKYTFASCGVCARSWAGRAIFTLGIGNQKDVVIYTGCINAMHSQTTFALLKVFEKICHAYSCNERICGIRLNDLLKCRGILFVPCLNPDGMEMHEYGASAAGCYAGLVQRLCSYEFSDWQANAAGIDLNHNISADWKAIKSLEMNLGYTSPGAKYYGGKACISEPETRAFVKLCQNRKVRHIITVGCGDNAVYGSNLNDEKQALMLKIFRLCSGFRTEEKEKDISTYNGFTDWFSAEFAKPAFSVEVNNITDEDYPGFEELCILSAIM